MSHAHPLSFKCTSRTGMSFIYSEQEDILLVACNFFHLTEPLSQIYNKQEVLLTPVQVGSVWFCFVLLIPMAIVFRLMIIYDLWTNAKLLGSLMCRKIYTYLILYIFSFLLRLRQVNIQYMTIHCFIDIVLYISTGKFNFQDFWNGMEFFSI